MTRHVVIGTAGHIDHGKTALVQALTGIDTDRLAEEKRRGITIDLGFAHRDLPSGARASFIDVPGHEDFIRNMVAGAAGIDVALLVVAADEGVMPQTREHLGILRMLGVSALVVALTKCDAVEADWLALAEDDLRGELAGTVYATAPVIPVSARTRSGIDELLRSIDHLAATAERGSGIALFRMPVDRGFTVHGTGTVVTGTIRDGVIETGAELRILPAGRTVRVRALQVNGEAVAAARTGMRAAAALTGVEKDAAGRGSWLVSASWPLTSRLTVRIDVLEETAWEIRHRQRVRLHVGTAEVMARVVLLDRTRLGAGDEGLAQLRLESPVVARYGDRFVLRSYSPVETIGGGRVLEAIAPGRRRIDEARLTLLTALDENRASALGDVVDAAGLSGIDAAELPIRFGPLHESAFSAVARVGGLVVSPAHLERAASTIVDAVGQYHRDHPLRLGMDRSEARRLLANTPAEVANFVIEKTVAAGLLRSVDGLLARPDFVPAARGAHGETLARLEALYEAAGLAAPRAEELPGSLRDDPDLRDLLQLLERAGALVPLPPDRLVHRRALEGAAITLSERAHGRTLTPADFRELFDLPRRHLIPLLEHFDRLGWTRREGEGRVVIAQKSAAPRNPIS